jgi:hypothetical protein
VFVADVEVEGEGRSIVLLAMGVGTGILFGKFAFGPTFIFFASDVGLEDLQLDEMYIFEFIDILFQFVIFLLSTFVFDFEQVISLQ